LVGRSEDLKWLKDTDGDLLLVGQPGSGKTFLLYSFAKRAGALFVHTTDLAAIAAGVRAEQPRALIVDDAHLQVDFLQQLRRLRNETGARFRLIADCWPGSQTEVARVMDLPSASIRGLSLLSMDEI
jgi:type II secretory pathway predicted ATPase ExeA